MHARPFVLVALGHWFNDRFPPVVYSLLVVLFYWAGASLVLGDGSTEGFSLRAAGVVWLSFLHLRIFDEFKDYTEDCEAYPDRVLSKGWITLRHLGLLGGGVLLTELLLAASLGRSAFVCWLLLLLFSVAMRFEFGFGTYLRDRLLLYAVTHNPITALIAIFIGVSASSSFAPLTQWGFWAFVAVSSFGSLAFELGRKIRLPEEEHPGVPSYSSVYGVWGARRALLASYSLVFVAMSACLHSLDFSWTAALSWSLLCVSPGLVSSVVLLRAKWVEAAASLVLLGSFVLIGLASMGGVA